MGAARAARSPSAVDGSPCRMVAATPSSMVVCESETATPGFPARFASAAARVLPSPTMSRAFQASIQSTRAATASVASSSPRPTEPRKRSKGCAIPTRPPWARTAAIACAGDRPGGIASSRNTPIRSPLVVRISWPTITCRPGASAAARDRASTAPSMRSWSVIARCVRPRAAAARMTPSGDASESKLAEVWLCRSTKARSLSVGCP